MSGLSFEKMLLLAKAQSAIDTEPTMTAATTAILASGIAPSVLEAEFVERNNMKPYKGNSGKLVTGVHRMFEYEIEMAGSGAAGTAPAFGDIIKGCGFAATTVASTSVAYAPVSSGEPWVAHHVYMDGLRFKMLNGKGSLSLDFTAKGIPKAKFKYLGAYEAMTDTTFPSGTDYTAFKDPLTVGKVNTPTFTFFGQTLCMQALTLDLANTLGWTERVNYAGARSPNRKPTGTIVAELGTVAELNWGETIRAGTTGVVQLIHGVTAGYIVQLDMPKIRITSKPTIQNVDGIAVITASYDIEPSSGNDEMVLTFK